MLQAGGQANLLSSQSLHAQPQSIRDSDINSGGSMESRSSRVSATVPVSTAATVSAAVPASISVMITTALRAMSASVSATPWATTVVTEATVNVLILVPTLMITAVAIVKQQQEELQQ